MSILRVILFARNPALSGGPECVSQSPPLVLRLTEDTSKDGCGACWANAIQRGASAPASMRPLNTSALATTPPADARGENVRPRRSSTSMRSPKRDLRPKIPTASSSRDSVRIGLLRAVDYQDFNRAFGRLKPEPKLVLQSGED